MFFADFMRTFNSCVVYKIRSCKPGCTPASPAAHFLCSTAHIRQGISGAWFCSCILLWRSDECVLFLCLAAWYFCSYNLLCRNVEFIFLLYPNLERW